MQGKIKIAKSIFLSRIKKQPYKLNFAITSACNSRCKTCNVWQAFQKNPQVIKNNLSLGEIKLIFKNFSPHLTWLSLSGGEPFLRKDLVAICQAALENIPNLGLISIPSNGLLEKIIIKQTKKILSLPIKNIFLNFSLDGPEAIHDKIRGVKGGYKKTWSAYQKILNLSKKHPKLHVNLETTISKFNLSFLEKFFTDLVKKGHKITITLAHTGYLYKNVDGNSNFTQLNHDGEKLKRIIKIVEKGLSRASPVNLIEKIYLEKIPKFYQKPKEQPLPCIALKSSFALDAQGNITPCFMWGKILGNIRDYDYNFKKFWQENLKEIKEVRKLIVKEKCPNCWTPCEAYQSIIGSLPIYLFSLSIHS